MCPSTVLRERSTDCPHRHKSLPSGHTRPLSTVDRRARAAGHWILLPLVSPFPDVCRSVVMKANPRRYRKTGHCIAVDGRAAVAIMRGMSVIKFGTSGWRGIISDTFTFANVEIAAHAIAQHLSENPPPNAKKLLIVGYDTRFLSRAFATRCAQIVAGYGFDV